MEQRPRLKGNRLAAFENITKDENRVLVIGDLHEPFCLKGYLRFCKETYAKHNCNKVVFIGDIIDNHYSSYHETDSDGMGGKAELDLAIKRVSKWYKAFPNADVTHIHGDKSSNARTATKRDMVSTVSGHFHTQMYVEWFFGKFAALFAMQVGCGIDSKSYAMGYMQGGKKEAIACGIVIGGHTAFNVKMDL
jgi:hypothetical protein